MREVSDVARDRLAVVEGLAQRLAAEALVSLRPQFADREQVGETLLAYAAQSVERGIDADPVRRVTQALLFLMQHELDPSLRGRIESAGPPRLCEGCRAQVWPQHKFCPQCGRRAAVS